MALEMPVLVQKVRVDTTGVSQSMGGVQKQAGALHSSFLNLRNIALAVGGAMVAGFAVQSVKAASDLNEAINKTQVVLGSAAADVLKWSEGTASSIGLSQKAALDAAGTFAIFGKSAGMSGKDLAKFSTDFTGLAADFASFFNTSPDEAITAIGAAFRGETEPIRRYGVLLDDATLKQTAFKMGIIKSTKEALTPQQRVLAVQAEILRQTSDAQGDFQRTADGAANSQRIMAAETENLKARLGSALLPMWKAVLQGANYLLGGLNALIDGFTRTGEEGEGFAGIMFRVGGILRDAWNAAQEGVKTLIDTVAGWGPAAAAMWDAVQPLVSAFGDVLYNAFRLFATIITDVVWPAIEGITNHIRDNQGFYGTLATIVGGALYLAFKALGDILGGIRTAIEKVTGFLRDHEGVAKGLATTLTVLLIPAFAQMVGALTVASWTTAMANLTGVALAIERISKAIKGSALVTGVGAIGTAITDLVMGISAGLGISAAAAGGIVIAIIAAIAAIGVGIYFLVKHWDDVKKAIGNAAGWVRDAFVKAYQAVSDFVMGLGKWFSDLPGKITGGLQAATEKVGEFFAGLPGIALEGLSRFASTLTDFFTSLPSKIWEALQGLGSILTDFFYTIPDIINAAIAASGFGIGFMIGLFLRPFYALAQALPGLAQGVWDFFTTIGPTIAGFFVDAGSWLLGAGATILGGMFAGIVIGAVAVWNWFLALPGNIWNLVTTAATWLLDTGAQILRGLWNGIVFGANAVWDWFRGLPGQIWGIVSNAPSWLLRTGGDVIGGLKSGLENAIWNVFYWFVNLPGRIVNYLSDAASWLIGVGADVIRGLWDGINSMKDWLLEKAKSFGGWLVDGFRAGIGADSPSRFMARDVGVPIMQGIAVGMEQGMPMVLKTAEASAAQIIAAFAKTATVDVAGVNLAASVPATLNAGALGASTLTGMKTQPTIPGASVQQITNAGDSYQYNWNVNGPNNLTEQMMRQEQRRMELMRRNK